MCSEGDFKCVVFKKKKKSKQTSKRETRPETKHRFEVVAGFLCVFKGHWQRTTQTLARCWYHSGKCLSQQRF